MANDLIYYKTPRCVGKFGNNFKHYKNLIVRFLIFFLELDNTFGDIVAAMSDIESKYMVMLIQFIHRRVNDIVEAVKLIAELDWYKYLVLYFNF